MSGRIVKWCEQNNKGLHDLTLAQYQSVHSSFDEELWDWLIPLLPSNGVILVVVQRGKRLSAKAICSKNCWVKFLYSLLKFH